MSTIRVFKNIYYIGYLICSRHCVGCSHIHCHIEFSFDPHGNPCHSHYYTHFNVRKYKELYNPPKVIELWLVPGLNPDATLYAELHWKVNMFRSSVNYY